MVRGGSATPTTVTHGIPQGSIVGPILFSLFCNDLPCYLEVEPVIYADDAHLLDRANPDTQNLTALKARIENTLSIMQNWYRSNSQQLVPRRFDLCSWLVRRSPTTPPAPQSLELPRCRLVCTQRSFRYRAAATWNDLSPEVTGSRSVRVFKRAIR